MQILIDRQWKKDTYTIGRIYVNGVFFCNSLEDKDRDLKDSMSTEQIAKIKVYGETAIPTGTYELKMTYSNKFASKSWANIYRGEVPEIVNVKGFTGIRIHPGNTAKDTYGCILVGKNSIKGRVTDSVKYYKNLLDNCILPAVKRKEKITITIK